MAAIDAEAELEMYRVSHQTAVQEAAPMPDGLREKLCQLTLIDREPDASEADELPAAIGPYRIVALRGRGGMGIVYDARDSHLDRRVAVKVLLTGRFSDPRSRERFVREARTAGGLRHDHLVPVYSAESPEEGPPYLVMPFIEGPTLDDLIQARRGLAPQWATEYLRQIADGLAAVHAAGIIHRDVKPGNILIDSQDNRAKLTDFGLARHESGGSRTTAGTIAGTPNYLSPEQIRTPELVDARSDIYSLGATLYECLTGVPPFRGPTLEVLRMIGEDEPVPPGRLQKLVPRDLETICQKCLEKNPARRYGCAAELRDDLARFLANEPILARPAGRGERSIRWVQRNPWVAAVIVVSMFGAVGAGLGWWRAAEKTEQARSAADAADIARQQADKRAALALNAITTLIGKSQALADRVPGTLRLKQDLAEAALADLNVLTAQVENIPGADRATIRTHFKISDAYRLLGKMSQSRAQRNRALELAGTLSRANPQDAEAWQLLGQANWNLSSLDRIEGNREALAHAEAAIAAFREACRLAPENAAYAQDLAGSINARADVLLRQSPSRKVLADYRQALAIYESLLNSHPRNSELRHNLAFTESRIVTALTSRFEFDEAAAHSTAATAYAKQALEFDPANLELQRAARIAGLDRANFLCSAGDYHDAAAVARTAVSECEPPTRLDPENGPLQRDLAIAHSLLGLSLLGESRYGESAREFEQSLAIREKLGAQAAIDIPEILLLLLGAEVRSRDYPAAAKTCRRFSTAIDPGKANASFQSRIAEMIASYELAPALIAQPAMLARQPAAMQPILACLLANDRVLAGKTREALETISAALAASPNDATVLANAMVIYSRASGQTTEESERQKRLESALAAAEKLAKEHRSDFPRLADYPELLPLRGYPPFQKLLKEFQQN